MIRQDVRKAGTSRQRFATCVRVVLERARVVYHYIGPEPFSVQRFLGGLAGVKFRIAPTRAPRALLTHLLRRIDKNHRIAKLVPASLQQHRGIQNCHDR